MEEAPAKQEYIVAPADPIYHLPLNDRLTLCMLWVHGDSNQRRRRDDRRLVAEKPAGRFSVLCRHCETRSRHNLQIAQTPNLLSDA
jgi:hypothetical protein